MQEFTEKENRAITAASWLVTFYLSLSGSYFAVDSFVDKVGSHILYIFSCLAFAIIITAIAYLIMFFKNLRKIKRYFSRYCVMALVFVLMGCCFGYLGFDYAADILCGTRTITTDEYFISGKNYIRVIDGSGEEVGIHLSDEVADILEGNSYIDGNPWSENALCYHKNSITVVYYPNSKVLSSAIVN